MNISNKKIIQEQSHLILLTLTYYIEHSFSTFFIIHIWNNLVSKKMSESICSIIIHSKVMEKVNSQSGIDLEIPMEYKTRENLEYFYNISYIARISFFCQLKEIHFQDLDQARMP